MMVAEIYFVMMLTLHGLDEVWNCYHPRKFPSKKYMVCQWSEEDIFKDKNGDYHPYFKSDKDNYFKRKARIIYWRRKQQGKE